MEQITHRHTGKALAEGETVKEAVEAAVKAGADLKYADLSGVSLVGTSLRGADLSHASLACTSLRGANLRGVSLVGTSLRSADLSHASLACTSLRGADLSHASLACADLKYTDLSHASLACADLKYTDIRGVSLVGTELVDANLRDAKLNWGSHDLLAELLRRAAGDDIEKLQVAGLVLIQPDKCWNWFHQLDHPLHDWAYDELATYVQDDDGAPGFIRKRVDIAKVNK